MLMAGGLCSTAKAQTAEIVEPDTTAADLMYLVAADNSLKALPMEDGKMEKHKNKFGKLASIVSTAASAAGALGGIGMIARAGSSSLGAVVAGAQVMGTAANLENLADAANTLAGAEGMDFTFDGPASNLKVKNDGKDVKVCCWRLSSKRCTVHNIN